MGATSFIAAAPAASRSSIARRRVLLERDHHGDFRHMLDLFGAGLLLLLLSILFVNIGAVGLPRREESFMPVGC